MNEHDWLAEQFESDRPRLNALALRMLGSPAEADDAVRQAWVRLNRSDTGTVPAESLSGWLTAAVARVSLDKLKSRMSGGEGAGGAARDGGRREAGTAAAGPEQEALLADAVGGALLAALAPLPFAERLAFVLHDMFAVPVEEIATVIDRTPAEARRLADRARRRVRQAGSTACARVTAAAENGSGTDDGAGLVRAFLDATHAGDVEALLAMLDPDIVVRADHAALRMGDVHAEIRGADAVTRDFAARVWAPRPALIAGAAGLVWAVRGIPRVAFRFTIDGGRITAIDIQAELAGLDISMT